MMYAVFLAVFAVVTVLSTFFAFRSKVEKNRFVSVLLAADYLASWVIETTTQPPLRPFIQAAIAFVLIAIFLRSVHLFGVKSVMRYAFPSGYGLMILASFIYLASHGHAAMLYYVTIDAIFLALAGMNIVTSIKDGARLDSVYPGHGRAVPVSNLVDVDRR